MAANDANAYGVDLYCFDDADANYSEVNGLPLIKQSAYHRLTNDVILGEAGDPDVEEYGYDVTKLPGMPADRLQGMQAVLAEVLQRDDRIETADVELTSTTNAAGLTDVIIKVTCTTALGPFSFVKSVSALTVDDLEAST